MCEFQGRVYLGTSNTSHVNGQFQGQYDFNGQYSA